MKMNTKILKYIGNIPEGDLVLIRHESFVKTPVEDMKYIYEQHLETGAVFCTAFFGGVENA